MIRDILLCLDGSPSGEAAARYAMALARELPAGLVAMAIVDEPDIRAGTPTGIGGSAYKHDRDESLVADARARVQALADAFAAQAGAAGLPQARAQVVVGRPSDCILEALDGFDAAVMGRDANFRVEIEESDTRTRDAVLHRATRPVLLVPAGTAAPAAGEHRGSALIAYDGSPASKRAVTSFGDSGLGRGRDVHVACVDDNGEEAWVMANRAAESLRSMGVPATEHSVVSPLGTAEALFDLGRKIDMGMLVLGAFSRSRVAHLIWGSVTRQLIEGTPVPIYLHR